MKCVANFEIGSECSIVSDDKVLNINHPKGTYRARIKNIPREDYSAPFRLSLHLYFDAPSLDEADDLADELLADCLNMISFATGSGVRRDRIRQIVNAEPTTNGGMREMLMWGDKFEHEDPQPFLEEENSKAIEKLLEFDAPAAIRRALRWYRLGVDSRVPDDQFTYFWFALEIVAEHQKSSEKVPSKCPHCQSPMYCETCEKHPVHRPYPKQAIRQLLEAADKSFDEATFKLLDKARNSLMHGATLKEIEETFPELDDHIVDILGRLVWKAIILQYPHEMLDGTLKMGFPSTFIHYTANAIAHVQTVVPVDEAGDFDLSFTGMKVSVVTDGPPQSARPFVVAMTPDQHKELGKLSYAKGDDQEMLKRIYQKWQEREGMILCLVLATDFAIINAAVERGDEGPWQDLFRKIIGKEPSD